MKKIFSLLSVSTLALLLMSGCKKADPKLPDFEFATSGQAFLKVNFVSIYWANPGVQITLNDKRVSSLITARTPFPGGGFNTGGGNFPDYFPLTPGSTSVGVVIPKRNTNVDSAILFKQNISLWDPLESTCRHASLSIL